MAWRKAGVVLGEDDLGAEHVAVEGDEAVEVVGEDGDVVDALEQGPFSPRWLLLRRGAGEQQVDGRGDGFGGRLAVPLPEVAQGLPDRRGAEDLDDRGDLSVAGRLGGRRRVGDDGLGRRAPFVERGEAGPAALRSGEQLVDHRLDRVEPGEHLTDHRRHVVGGRGESTGEPDPVVRPVEHRCHQGVAVGEVPVDGALRHSGRSRHPGERQVPTVIEDTSDPVEHPLPHEVGGTSCSGAIGMTVVLP